MINLYLGAALVVAPFYLKLTKLTAPTLSQEYFLVLTSIFGVFFFGIKRRHLNFKLMAMGLILSAFVTSNPYGLFQYYQTGLIAAGIAFMAVIYSRRSLINLKLIQRIMGAICLLEAGFIILQFYKLDPFAFYLKAIGKDAVINAGVSGSLGNINHSGALVAITMPFLSPYLWPFAAFALFVGKSTMPVITAFIAILTLLSYRLKKYLLLKLGAFCLFIAAIITWLQLIPQGHYFSDTHRVAAWKKLLNEVGLQFFGKGFGYIPDEFSKIALNGGKFYQIHNEWLELYASLGLLGIAVGLFLILPVFKNKGNPAINACAISLLVNSLGSFPFHIAPLFMIFGTCYALQLKDE